MRRLIFTMSTACAVGLLLTALGSAQILNADRTTYITFSAPVALPGVTLPAGTYTFKLLDSQATRNVVQIFDKERTKILATILAIPAQRNEPADESLITFKEAPANAPPAVHFWYYAGEKTGQEFAYPKAQAMLIANASKESVLAIDTESTNFDDMKGAEMTRVNPTASAEPEQKPEQPPVTEPAAAAPTPAQPPAEPPQQPATPPSTVTPAQPTTPAPAAEAPVGTSGRTEAPTPALPQTASELPLVGLVGFLALGGAVAARVLRRRLA
jgi:hypothetical protein